MQRDTLKRINDDYRAADEFKHLHVNNFVPGDGPLLPRLMIIGEAPGVEEDKHLRPFVGRSGNMLDNALWDLHLKRTDCYITNVVKYRPPENRTPTAIEVADAVPFLRREVMTVLPKGGTVVLLGRVALSLVDEDLRISKVQGHEFSRNSWTFMPMYHPAYIMRNEEKLQPVWRAGWAHLRELLEAA